MPFGEEVEPVAKESHKRTLFGGGVQKHDEGQSNVHNIEGIKEGCGKELSDHTGHDMMHQQGEPDRQSINEFPHVEDKYKLGRHDHEVHAQLGGGVFHLKKDVNASNDLRDQGNGGDQYLEDVSNHITLLLACESWELGGDAP